MYDAFSLLYDRFVNWQSRLAYEMPFIESQLRMLGKEPQEIRILDAACGTGMHVIELSQRGYHAAGADSSKAMILKAIENAAAFEIQVKFKTAGFGDLHRAFIKGKNTRPFDSLFCLGNSLPHILSVGDLESALADFRACLSPGGFLLLQIRNFDAVSKTQQRWMEPQSYRGEGGEWIFIRFYDFRQDDLIDFNILTLHRKEKLEWEQSIQTVPLYPWQSDTLIEIMKSTGFIKVSCYGDMQGSAYDPEKSGNLVIRADY